MHGGSILLLLLVSFASLWAQPTVEDARAALVRGDTTAAIVVLDRHLNTQPDDVPVLLLRSVAAEKVGELAGAVYFSGRALEAQERLNPGIKPFPTTLARHRTLFDRLVAAHPAPATVPAAPRTADGPAPTARPAPPPAPIPGVGLQWAIAAKASSEYRVTNYGVAQATGAPNVRSHGDSGSAWAPKTDDGGAEWLELAYATAVRATGVRVVQSFNPGAVTKIETIDPSGAAASVWSGPDATAYAPRQIGVLEVTFPAAAQPVAKVRLTLDTKRVPGSNAIDAVALLGGP